MRVVLLVFAIACALPAGAQTKQSAQKSTPPAQSKAQAIPKGAKEIEPGVYRWTDPEGKTWILRKSPFGVLKGEEKDEKKAPLEATDDLPQGLTVTEQGDELRFERPTPFGLMRWQRKKTELNEMEQRAWEREQKRRAESRPKE